jgi:hypothetical protein
MNKPTKVVMLPTEGEGVIMSDVGPYDMDMVLMSELPEKLRTHERPHNHVYITDMEPIKEGWVYDPIIKKVFFMDSIIGIPNKVLKIIATTDPKLKQYIPQVQQSFLKEFVANPDGEWEVEHECTNNFCGGESGNICYCNDVHFKLKINTGNTVNITSVKEKIYTIKEVEGLLHRVVNDSHCMHNRITQPSSNKCADFTINWIKKNL